MDRNLKNKIVITLPNSNEMTFEEIYRTYEGKVFRFVGQLIKKSEDAEEVVQDVFIKLWLKRESLMTKDSIADMLFFLARAESINFLKSKKYRDSLAVDSLDNLNLDIVLEGNAKDLIYAQELELLIRAIVEKMPEKQQLIFNLSHFEELSNEKIAYKLNISEKSVRNQLGLILNKLRSSLSYYKMLLLFLISSA